MIQHDRIQILNERPVRDRRYVLYWMQASQRAEMNHALEHAVIRADALGKPVLVFFGLTDRFPEANERHYVFMLEGLREVQAALAERRICMVIRAVSPEVGVLELAKDADLVVTDRGYLRIQRDWRTFVAERLDCPLVQVESDAVVPVETASPKEEYAAATLRPKIRKVLDGYLVPVQKHVPRHSSLHLDMPSLSLENIDEILSDLNIDRSVKGVDAFRGGTSRAHARLQRFLEERLARYADLRNDPAEEMVSDLSPYLHFGQISPLTIALEVLKKGGAGADDFLEELIVRRELSMNFVYYNAQYDSFQGLPEWAKASLKAHEQDPREFVYSPDDLEHARTHDPYWNAAQEEMRIRGKMHGYIRMYWGKKIIEWTPSPEEAFRVALVLNNKYELDGRDPNGFTGVAWCFGRHDRAWAERPIFGKVRYMNANGLRRKFDIDRYVDRVDKLKKG